MKKTTSELAKRPVRTTKREQYFFWTDGSLRLKVDRVRVRGKVAVAISVQRADPRGHWRGFSTTLTAADAVKLADALNDALDDPTEW